MKPRVDEEKKNRRRNDNEYAETPKSPKSADTDKSATPPTQELKHEDVIWPFYLCLDTNFAKTFMCSECKQIPKQTHAFTSKHGYIYCEYCIDHLIKTQKLCKISNKSITHKNPAKVIDNLVKTLRIKCPHCKQSQLQQLQQLNDNIGDVSKSELKIDEIDDIEDDNINIPPFPTSHVNNMMNEGVNENQMGIVGIAAANHKKNVYYCEWIGTIKDLPYHLQNDCEFIKINCPLFDLDSTLCDVQNLYPHELRKHIGKCSVTHWQHIVKQINEIKSMQLSIVLKQQLFGEKPMTNTPKTPSNSNTTMHRELQQKMDKMDKKLQDLDSENRTKDVLISAQNNTLNLMQKEIAHLKKIMEQQLSSHRTTYQSDITSMFNHSNYALNAHKMHEMQQNLSQTQNKIDLISNEMKVKDNLISSLHSQIATMNTIPSIQPGTPHSHSYDYSHSDPVLLSSKSMHSYSPHRNTRYHQQHIYPSKSLTNFRMNDKIYRSDSGGNSNDEIEHVPMVPAYRHRHGHRHKHNHSNNKGIPQPQQLVNTRKSVVSKSKKPVLSLYGVGYNEEGEIGLGHRNNLCSFTRLPFCDKYDIISIYYGSQSFFYLTASNELYCCGYNKYGQLGLGHTSEYIIKPTLNKYFKSEERFIDFISNSVCAYHTILKTQKNGNKLYGYGWNNNGQLGIGKKSFKESVPIELTADIFYNKNTGNIISISCGFHHTLFLTDGGKVICCGNNQYGQLGFGSNVSEVMSPSFIDGLNLFKNIIGVQCGEYYSCCLDKNGFVFVFGRNDSGQLGLGNVVKNEECVYIPTILQYFKQNGIVVTKIQCGDYHTLCLDSKGNVYAFGNNEYGQIGCGGLANENNNLPFINLPNLCKLPNNNKSKVVIDIDVGAYHSLLLSEDNEIYSFGNNDCNQCSTILNHKKINAPYWLKKKTEIKCLNNTNIIQIIAGYDCSFLVTNEE